MKNVTAVSWDMTLRIW